MIVRFPASGYESFEWRHGAVNWADNFIISARKNPQPGGYGGPPLVTAGDDVAGLARFLPMNAIATPPRT